MQAPDFIRQIPDYFDHACFLFIDKGTEAQQWVTDHANTIMDYIGHTDFWLETAKPIYERNFEPLTKLDYMLFAGSVATAVIATKIAIHRFSIGALPIAAGVGTLMVMASFYFSQHRVHKHFNEVAWNYVDEIRKFAHVTTTTNQKFADINQRRIYLNRPEFERLDNDLKLLDEEIRKFRIVVLTPHSEDKKEVVQAHIAILRLVVATPSADQTLLVELENAIDKVGQKEQDLKELETKKQKISGLQTPAVIPHINELKKQVNELVKAAEGPNFQDSKQAFIEHLTGLQKKLAPYFDVEPLFDTPIDESHSESEVDSEDSDREILVDEEESSNSHVLIEEVKD